MSQRLSKEIEQAIADCRRAWSANDGSQEWAERVDAENALRSAIQRGYEKARNHAAGSREEKL